MQRHREQWCEQSVETGVIADVEHVVDCASVAGAGIEQMTLVVLDAVE